MRIIPKLLIVVGLVISYLTQQSFIQVFFLFFPQKKTLQKSLLIKGIGFYSKICLKILGIQVKSSFSPKELEHKLVVCNHMSYIDVLVLSTIHPIVFLTSVEMKNSFGIGLLAEMAGTLYTERRKHLRDAALEQREIAEVKMTLAHHSMAFFPEGTSTSGETVLRFKAKLFNAVVAQPTPIISLSLNYLGPEADKVPWYGDQTFLPHLIHLCKKSSPVIASLKLVANTNGQNFSSPFDLAEFLEQGTRKIYLEEKAKEKV